MSQENEARFWSEIYRGLMMIVSAIIKYKLKHRPIEVRTPMSNPDYLER